MSIMYFQRQKERRKMERGERMEEASEQVSHEEPNSLNVMYCMSATHYKYITGMCQ